ncbi:MAG: DUF4129 domain-containing protein [Pirellulales bacterium]|nr:DUF4129 domain-containing protein [Pirellulales bacterium]
MPRLDKTLADYLAIAISPVLIMLMVGSMMYFLVTVFYVGCYDLRIYWILGCFTVAIVLISRISIEDGQERAILFGAALAGATGLAVMRFANIIFLPWLLLALAWWSAAKLTWDCTLIDEEQDSSGQGLLQIVTFGKRKPKEQAEPPKTAPTDGTNGSDDTEPEGVTTRVSKLRAEAHTRLRTKGRAHAPGVWIIYFSLAALPMFGLGQLLIPVADIQRRQWAFTLLCWYVGSGLGLLLTTSFLGLRRYLRQRGVEMPDDMAAVWIGLGAGMIVVILFLVALLPRPAAEYKISQFPLTFTTPERESSRWVMGDDGSVKNVPDLQSRTTDEEEQQGPESSSDSREKSDKQTSDDSESRERKSSKSKQQSPDKSESGERGDRKPREDKKTGEQQKRSEQRRQDTDTPSEQDDKEQGNNKQGEKQQGDKKQGDKNQGDKKQDEKEQGESSESRPREEEASKGGRRRDQDKKPLQEKQTQEHSKSSGRSTREPGKSWLRFPRVSISLGGIFKLIVYAILLGIAVYLLWKSRDRVLAGIRQFLQELREFWARLFGGHESSSEEDAKEASGDSQPRPFSEYRDPFTSGMIGRHPPEQIVRYTFEALEAWAREHDCGREPEQTPREFALQVGGRFESLSGGVNLLADLYSLVAYARGRPNARSIEPLAQLWQGLKVI